MKQAFKKICSFALLLSGALLQADQCGSCPTTSCYPNRSQSRYKMRQVSGMRGHTHDVQNDMAENYWGTLSITPGYHQTFRSEEIAKCLFDNDLIDNGQCTRTIRIQGSNVDAANRETNAWLADYFYLARDFDSTITFDPKIKNFIFDFDLYVGLDKWREGAYLRIHGPIVHTRWDLNFNENITNVGTDDHTQGYFTPDTLANANLLKSFADFAQGKAPDAVTQTVGTVTETITFQPLKCAKMANCERTKTGLADLRLELGWNFIKEDDHHLGIALAAAVPTGNKCCPNWLFDAVVGNQNHWELGGVLTGHYIFWRSQDTEKHIGFYLDANVTHMFKSTGRRTFDLKGKPNSKYMLASKFENATTDFNDPFTSGLQCIFDQVIPKTFAHEFAPVANISTVNVETSASVHADIVAWTNFTAGKFSWDLGYNFYARGCEQFECVKSCDCTNDKPSVCDIGQEQTWALKGDARMYGFLDADVNPLNLSQNDPVPLSTTQSDATIHGGNQRDSITGKTMVTALTHTNDSADNAQEAFYSPTPLGLVGVTVAPAMPTLVHTSAPPVFISCDALDFSGTKNISHSIFTHLNYHFEARDNWRPYLGVGAMVEFGSHNNCCDTDFDDDCNSCLSCGPSYWGVWVKGGVSFD